MEKELIQENGYLLKITARLLKVYQKGKAGEFYNIDQIKFKQYRCLCYLMFSKLSN